MKPYTYLLLPLVMALPAFGELASGDKIQLTMRGIPEEDRQTVGGIYRLNENGAVRLPLLDSPIKAEGLEPDAFAQLVENAYKNAGLFNRPTVEVEVLEGGDQEAAAAITVAGQVKQAGEAVFRKNMTVLQAIDGAGGLNEFGGRNIILFRKGKQYTLDFKNLAHKNIALEPGDALQAEQKGALMDRWKGDEERIKDLLK